MIVSVHLDTEGNVHVCGCLSTACGVCGMCGIHSDTEGNVHVCVAYMIVSALRVAYMIVSALRVACVAYISPSGHELV